MAIHVNAMSFGLEFKKSFLREASHCVCSLRAENHLKTYDKKEKKKEGGIIENENQIERREGKEVS